MSSAGPPACKESWLVIACTCADDDDVVVDAPSCLSSFSRLISSKDFTVTFSKSVDSKVEEHHQWMRHFKLCFDKWYTQNKLIQFTSFAVESNDLSRLTRGNWRFEARGTAVFIWHGYNQVCVLKVCPFSSSTTTRCSLLSTTCIPFDSHDSFVTKMESSSQPNIHVTRNTTYAEWPSRATRCYPYMDILEIRQITEVFRLITNMEKRRGERWRTTKND